MNARLHTFSRLFIAAALLLVLALPARAQITLTFDSSELGNPDYNPNNIYVTFAGFSSNMSIGNTSINFSNSTIGGNGTSASFSLADISGNGGVVINSATSIIGFVSYGSNTTGFANLSGQPNFFDNGLPRYSNFEFSYNEGNSGVGGADLTNIAQFGGALKMSAYSGNVVSNATLQSYVANSGTSGDLFRALAAASGNTSPAVFTTGTGASETFVRIIGPSKYPYGPTSTNNPYQTFNTYLGALYTSSGNGTNSVATLQNLYPGAPAGGQGSIGFSKMVGNTSLTFNADYDFTAKVVAAGNGTYGVTLSGNVVFVSTNTTLSPNYTYSNLSITIGADVPPDLYMTNFLYQEANPGGNQTNLTFSSGWGDIDNDFAGGNSTINQKVFGDFAQGMLLGLVGSTTPFNGTSTMGNVTVNGTVGSFSSVTWWLFPELAYKFAQPTEVYFNEFGEVIWDQSEGFNSVQYPGVSFTGGAVYGNPYDDRYSSQLLNLEANTTNLVIALLPDGNVHVVVPEPGEYALLAAGLALAAAALARRRRAAA